MNTLFTSIFDDVVTITNRPELVADITYAIKHATAAVHRYDFFPRDRVESTLTFPESASEVTIDIPTNLPRFRQFCYIRPYDTTTGEGQSGTLLEFIDPTGIFDDYLRERSNVAYIAGSNVNMKLATAATGVIVCYYQNPITDPDLYDSWIASSYSTVIVAYACMLLFAAVGLAEESQRYAKMAELGKIELIGNCLLGTAI